MKLGSLKSGRDGELVVVSRDLKRAARASQIAPTMQKAMEDWDAVSPRLKTLYDALNAGTAKDSFDFDPAQAAAPMPRAFQWLDGSAYLSHVEAVRAARGVKMTPDLQTDPLMYQGDGDYFGGPRDAILAKPEWGIDCEGEIAVFLGDVPMGTPPEKAASYIRLITILNDISLRNLIPAELAKGFGFLQGKAVTCFAPVAVTPDELGSSWDGHKVSLPLKVEMRGAILGEPLAHMDMSFDFPRLIAHAAKTRPLGAGTVLGSGTISNYDRSRGVACISELRALETVKDGKPSTPFMNHGDRVKVEMIGSDGASIFGAIDHVAEPPPNAA